MAAPGPSLTPEVAGYVYNLETADGNGWPTVVVQDAYRLMPWADILYGCDAKWWNSHDGVMGFEGQKWSSHCDPKDGIGDAKIDTADKYGLNLVDGRSNPGFSTDQSLIHYGDNSGFQALNLAILLGAAYIVLVGFDMRHAGGKSHFFGDHPRGLHQRPEYESFAAQFKDAPEGVTIVNATPNSALRCYPMMDLEKAVEDSGLYRNRPIINTSTG